MRSHSILCYALSQHFVLCALTASCSVHALFNLQLPLFTNVPATTLVQNHALSQLELLEPDVAPRAPEARPPPEEWSAFESAAQPPALSMVAAPQLPWANKAAARGAVAVAVAVAAHM